MHNTTSRFFGSSTRAGLFVALAASILALTLPSNAYAKSVACLAHAGGVTCYHSNKSCAVRNTDYRSGNPSCVDYAAMHKVPGSVSLTREKGGLATITIGDKKIKIASAALESFLESKDKEASVSKQRGVSSKMIADRFREELEAFLKTDKWLVSEARLSEISRELNIPITHPGPLINRPS